MDDILSLFMEPPVVVYDQVTDRTYYPEYKVYITSRTDGKILIVFEDTGHEYLGWRTPIKDGLCCLLIRFGINWNIMVNNYNNDDYETMNKYELSAISYLLKLEEFVHVKSLHSDIHATGFNSTMKRVGGDSNRLLYYTGIYHSKKRNDSENSVIYSTRVVENTIT